MRRSLQRFQRLDRAEARSDVKISWLSLMELCFQPIFHGEDYAPIAELDDVFVMAVSHNAQGISDEQVCDSRVMNEVLKLKFRFPV